MDSVLFLLRKLYKGTGAMRVTQPSGQLWNQAMQVLLPDDQILNQFATNQKMHIQMKYQSIQVTPPGGQTCN